MFHLFNSNDHNIENTKFLGGKTLIVFDIFDTNIQNIHNTRQTTLLNFIKFQLPPDPLVSPLDL